MKLSNEEKEAIKYLNKYIKWETYGERSLEKDIKTVLDIIENLQKEIDDWKFTAKYVDKNYISKDKIKKKIKEYDGLKEIDKQAYEEQVKPLRELLRE